MGRRGPIPKRPKLFHGDGKAAPPAVVKPDWLTGAAAALWDELIPELMRMGILAPCDAMALACLCQRYATWRAALDTLDKAGLTYTAESGLEKRPPAAAVAEEAEKLLLMWLKEF